MVGRGLIAALVLMGPDVPPGEGPSRAPAAAPGENASEARQFAKRLEAVDAAMAKVTDLRADFEQRRHTMLLKKPLVSRGTVLTKGERVRWDTAMPRASTLLLDGVSVRMYYPEDNLVEVYPLGEGFKDLAGAPLPRLSLLKERFDIAQMAVSDFAGSVESPNLLAIRLTPKLESLKSHVAEVKVLIDESQPAATRVVIIDSEGERTEIEFSKVRLNGGVKQVEIDLRLPEGVRVSHPLGVDGAAPTGDREREGKP